MLTASADSVVKTYFNTCKRKYEDLKNRRNTRNIAVSWGVQFPPSPPKEARYCGPLFCCADFCLVSADAP